METFQEALERRHATEREIGYAMWAVDDKATGMFVGNAASGRSRRTLGQR
jgi:hypothetical protein